MAESDTNRIENVIGPSASFKGDLKCDGGVRIDGVFEGSLETAGNVIVGEAAKVEADIWANNVSVAGSVKGEVRAQGRLEILSTGAVWGNIAVDAFLIDEGGFYNGAVSMAAEEGTADPGSSGGTEKAPP